MTCYTCWISYWISEEYAFISRKMVEEYCKLCTTCTLKRAQNVVAPMQPILTSNFMERLQIDLIDLRNTPDGEFKWICHVIDHFTIKLLVKRFILKIQIITLLGIWTK